MEPRLLEDKNILYNYLMKLLIERIITSADYIANALYTYYEYHNSIYKDVFNHKIHVTQEFPYKTFGK